MTRLRFGLMGWLALVLLGISTPAWAIQDHREFTLQSAVGSTANGAIAYVEGFTSVGLDITITNTATVTFEGSVAGTGWTSVTCTSAASTSGTRTTTATASGLYQCNVAGLSVFRARISAWTSGTVTAVARATDAVLGGGAGGGTVAIDQTTPGTTNGVSLTTLLRCEDETNNLCMTSGAWVRQDTLMTGVITNTTSTAILGFTGPKSIRAEVAGTGAVTATIAYYCDDDSDAANGDLLGTLTLSGTTLAKDRLPVITAPCKYLYATTTNVTGTSATVLTKVSY